MNARLRRRLTAILCTKAVVLGMTLGPAASWLQSAGPRADPRAAWDAVYLVAGARAQDRRIGALTNWVAACSAQATTGGLQVLVGNDPQISLWCREHQTNHTRTAWAMEKLDRAFAAIPGVRRAEVVPGAFSSTDGEMRALHDYLATHPDVTRIALVTSRFHIRRTLDRARRHNPSLVFGVVPGPRHWEDRAPWIVVSEYAKLLRDALGLSRAPGLTRGRREVCNCVRPVTALASQRG